MSNEENEEQIEDDPRIANIYRRMRLLVGVSLLVMAAGFFVVFGVIIYRLTAKAPDGAALALAGLDLPGDARLISMTADGGRIFLAVEAAGRTRVHVLDASELREVGRIDFGAPIPQASVPLVSRDALPAAPVTAE